jgi:SAM-dependent methyltransferase
MPLPNLSSTESTAAFRAGDRATIHEAVEILDRAVRNLTRGANVFEQLEAARTDLLEVRAELGAQTPGSDWDSFAKEQFHNHPFRKLVHASPFSRRSYEQPRGYAGDAETLDYIYGLKPLENVSDFGRAVFDWEYQTQSCRSVRARVGILAKTIDEVAAARPRARMLSIACGHLREARLSGALQESRVEEFLALDQDEESLALIARESEGTPIRAVAGSVRSLLTGKTTFQDLDLVYAAGLYDYLTEPVATRLTALMFRMLRPGGRLLVANFHPDLGDTALMETMMRWWLIYRNEDEVARLAGEIDRAAIASENVFRDVHGNVVYLDLTRG